MSVSMNMIEVEFVKISPTQNMTILVTSPVARERQAEIAKKIMAYDSVHGEQVGFVEKPGDPNALARLQMAGGEFCGNASLALCAYLVWKGALPCPAQGSVSVPIEASGAGDILRCEITRKAGFFLGKLNMPAPDSVKHFDAEIEGASYSLPVVHLPGISHVIAETKTLKIDKNLFAEKLIEHCDVFTKEEAFGIMFYDSASCAIEPFVYVKTVGTRVWERGCGSGTAALGAYLASLAGGSVTADVAQPGGVITVGVTVNDGKITGVSIQGKIEIAAWGKALVDL
ncbi:MAG: hypothetical protein FWG66_11915 [Spirochaetes bacterium]|nr:hypothetical protein [Spirochaetota bacterium]